MVNSWFVWNLEEIYIFLAKIRNGLKNICIFSLICHFDGLFTCCWWRFKIKNNWNYSNENFEIDILGLLGKTQ